jgi:hypothetical protein
MREVPVKGQRQANGAKKVGYSPQPEQRPRERYAEGQQGGRLDHPEHYYRKNVEQYFLRADPKGLALFLELFLFGGAKASRRSKRFAVVVQGQIAHVEQRSAGRRLFVDHDGDRASLDAVAKRDAATTGETRMSKPLGHLP